MIKEHQNTFCECGAARKSTNTQWHTSSCSHACSSHGVYTQNTSSQIKLLKNPRWQYQKHSPRKKKWISWAASAWKTVCIQGPCQQSERQPTCTMAEPREPCADWDKPGTEGHYVVWLHFSEVPGVAKFHRDRKWNGGCQGLGGGGEWRIVVWWGQSFSLGRWKSSGDGEWWWLLNMVNVLNLMELDTSSGKFYVMYIILQLKKNSTWWC